MVSDKVYEQCTARESVSSELAKSPNQAVGDVAHKLYSSDLKTAVESKMPDKRHKHSDDELQRARQCGRFDGTEPSELFLHAFHDILGPLEKDPLAGVVSPSLIGSTGVNPFVVIGPLNDICRHMSNLIVRAEKEVLLATNYWMASGASTLITDALRELSRRHGERGSGQKLPFKIMYDRGDVKQVIDNHQAVPPEKYAVGTIKMPSPQDIPHIDLQVVNYHKPMLGTFHSKFMIIDRIIGITQSNNIQDNDNVEMMAQLEGPIVDSLWETFLVSWHKNIEPIACLQETAASKQPPTFQEESFKALFTPEGLFRVPDERPWDRTTLEHVAGELHYDSDVAGEIHRMHATLSPHTDGETQPQIVARHLNAPTKLSVEPTAPAPESKELNFFPFIPMPPHSPVPMALVSRKPYGNPTHTSLHVPQNEAFLSLIQHAKHSIFIQTPDLNASPLYDALLAAIRRGIEVTYYVCLGYNDQGELLPGQNGTNEMFAHSLLHALEEDGGPDAIARLRVYFYTAKDQDHPICNKFKQRSCHIKLLIADEHVAVQGSGNQDTQSWWQSQEVNVMIDSPTICKAWREGIERNQNTATYGRAASDGCWRDKDGKLAEGSLGVDPGTFAWAKGMVGAFKRATGKGGF